MKRIMFVMTAIVGLVALADDGMKWKLVPAHVANQFVLSNDVWSIRMTKNSAKGLSTGLVFRGAGELDLSTADEDIAESGWTIERIGYSWYNNEDGWKDIPYVGADKFTGIVLPPNVTRISQQAFKDCSNLGRLIMGDKVTRISYNAFSCGTTVDSQWQHQQVKTVPSALSNVVLSASLEWIEHDVFAFCTNLTTVTPLLPTKLEKIDACAFAGCPIEGDLVLTAAQTLEKEAFAGQRLSTVSLNEGITLINDRAFKTAKAMARLNEIVTPFPSTLATLGGDVFSGNTNLHGTVDFSACTAIRKFNASIFSSTGVENAILPPGLTNVADNAFNECGFLTNVVATIPTDDLLKSQCTANGYLGRRVFSNCKKLVSVEIPWGGTTTFYNLKIYKDNGDIDPNQAYYAPFSYTESLTRIKFFGKAPANMGGKGGFLWNGGKVWEVKMYVSKKMDKDGWISYMDELVADKAYFGKTLHYSYTSSNPANVYWEKSPLDPVTGLAVIVK